MTEPPRRSRIFRRTNVSVDQPVEELPQHVIKHENRYECTLCKKLNVKRQHVADHVKSKKHINKLIMLTINNEGELSSNDTSKSPQSGKTVFKMEKGEVVVTLMRNGELTPQKFRINKQQEETLTVHIANQSPTSLLMEYCNFTVPARTIRSVRRRIAIFKLFIPNGPTCRISAGERIEVSVNISVKNVGIYSKSLYMKFSDGSEEGTFNIIRKFTAVCTNDVIENLKPKSPYKRQRIKAATNKEIVPGLRLPTSEGDSLEFIIPLPPFRISAVFRHAVKNGLTEGSLSTGSELEREIRRIWDLMERELTFKSYEEQWTVLLSLEKIQAEINVQQFNMENVTMTVCRENTRFLVLKVPGLAENRPSLLKGDTLYVSLVDVSTDNDKEYEGQVHNILQLEIWLGFSNRFRNRFNEKSIRTQKFNVRFGVPDHVYRLQQRAVTMAAKIPELSTILFPLARSDEKQNRPPPMLPLNTTITYYNQNVACNKDQATAVLHIVAGTSRPAPYLLFGPPGTGKTVTLVESILQTLHFHANAHILACAPSNSAADLLTERLASYLKKDGKDGKDASKTLFRIHARSRSWITVPEYIQRVSNYRGGDYYYPSKAIIADYRVVITTLSTAGRLVSAKFPAGHFTHLFIDECGQATEPECVIPMAGVLSYNTTDYPNGGQVVLAGDPKQLGPVVLSPEAYESGLEESLLERLMLDVEMYKRREGTNPPYDVTVMTELRKNYRSHPAILAQPNRQFYHGDLEYAADKRQRDMFVDWTELPKRGFPVIFHGTMGKEMREGNSPSFYNPQEIDVVLQYVDKLLVRRSQEFKTGDIAIITPYRKQVQKLQKVLRERNLDSIKVGPVEEFQGQERHVIIVTTVRSNPHYLEFDTGFELGFVANPKKYNVAITRAKSLLIVVGNARCLHEFNEHWQEFIQYCDENDALLGEEMLDEFYMPKAIRKDYGHT